MTNYTLSMNISTSAINSSTLVIYKGDISEERGYITGSLERCLVYDSNTKEKINDESLQEVVGISRLKLENKLLSNNEAAEEAINPLRKLVLKTYSKILEKSKRLPPLAYKEKIYFLIHPSTLTSTEDDFTALIIAEKVTNELPFSLFGDYKGTFFSLKENYSLENEVLWSLFRQKCLDSKGSALETLGNELEQNKLFEKGNNTENTIDIRLEPVKISNCSSNKNNIKE